MPNLYLKMFKVDKKLFCLLCRSHRQPYKLVKDVRTGHETGNVDAVMNGDLNGFLKAFLMTYGN